ncbi:MAG: tetratricopeptide repeat protein [Actinomycetota bacterium]|nr:tetratricopeptide repeat protein [Actinomycetota bacterium]
MPKSLKKRSVKKPRPEQAEDFEQIKENLKAKQRSLIVAGAAAVAALVLAGGIYFYISYRNSKSTNLNYQGYKLYYNLYLKEPMTKDERLQKALEKFQEAYNTKESAYPLFYIGSIQYDMGKYADAIKTFSNLAAGFPDDGLVPLAKYRMAMASMKMGNQQDALKYLGAIENDKSASLKDLALYESARIYDAIGNKTEAQRELGTLRQNFPSSPFLANSPAAAVANTPAPAAGQKKALKAGPAKKGTK